MNLLHIHQDFPDGRPFAATKAVSNLIEAVEEAEPQIEHFVLSINRTSNPFKISLREFDRGISIIYWSLPLPFIYHLSIMFWSSIIFRRLKNHGVDIIHAHKVTTEGMFAFYLGRKMKVDYIVSIRGGSDLHNIQRLKDCRKLFKKIFLNAKRTFWVSKWAIKGVETTLNLKINNVIDFPNICHIEGMSPDTGIIKDRYCTILNFDQYKRKGIIPLIHSISNLNRNGQQIRLDIIGGGNKNNILKVKRLITELKLEGYIEIVGKLDSKGVLHILRSSRGLLLPSINETFGMVYVEAAACGCPFLYVGETGIDGYFDNLKNSVKINNQKVKSIEEGIMELEHERNLYLHNSQAIAINGDLKRFQKKTIAETYINQLKCLTKFK